MSSSRVFAFVAKTLFLLARLFTSVYCHMGCFEFFHLQERARGWDQLVKNAQLQAFESLKAQLRDSVGKWRSDDAESALSQQPMLDAVLRRLTISIESVHIRIQGTVFNAAFELLLQCVFSCI